MTQGSSGAAVDRTDKLRQQMLDVLPQVRAAHKRSPFATLLSIVAGGDTLTAQLAPILNEHDARSAFHGWPLPHPKMAAYITVDTAIVKDMQMQHLTLLSCTAFVATMLGAIRDGHTIVHVRRMHVFHDFRRTAQTEQRSSDEMALEIGVRSGQDVLYYCFTVPSGESALVKLLNALIKQICLAFPQLRLSSRKLRLKSPEDYRRFHCIE